MTEGTVAAPAAIEGEPSPSGAGRHIYGAGDLVPVEVAKKLHNEGRWPGPDPLPKPAKKTAKRAKKGPAEDRARKPSEDRGKK